MDLAPLRRVGVFGGAFDPPHNAHVALAQAALAQEGPAALAELRILPTGQAWHKARALSPADHREAMARLAFESLPRTVVDSRELLRDGPTYTLDTLRDLLAEQGPIQPVLIIGADQAGDFPRWHGWREILQIAIVSIAGRAHPAGAAGQFDPDTLVGLPPTARLESLPFTPMALSATAIRARVAAHEPIEQLVPAAVARYIARHHLYTAT